MRCSEIIQVQRFCKLQGLLFQNNTRNWNIVCTSVVERSVNCLVKVFIFCSFHLLSFWVNFSRFISSQNFIFFASQVETVLFGTPYFLATDFFYIPDRISCKALYFLLTGSNFLFSLFSQPSQSFLQCD